MSEKKKSQHNALAQLNALEEKKLTLARVIKIARSLELMRSALTAVVQFGEPEADLPPTVLNFFTALGKKVRNLSDLEVLARLDKLQASIRIKLTKVMAITAELDDLDDLNDQRIDEINLIVEEYKRHAHTAVALSILLQHRGVPIKPMGLSVTKETILGELKRITSEENQQREKAIEKIIEIRNDIGIIRGNPNTSETTRAILSVVAENLKQNILHLRAGLSISDLPFDVEVVEFDNEETLADLPIVEYESDESDEDSFADNLPLIESSELPVAKDQQEPADILENVAGDTAEAIESAGLWQRFNLWLNAPWDVSWNSLKKKPPKK